MSHIQAWGLVLDRHWPYRSETPECTFLKIDDMISVCSRAFGEYMENLTVFALFDFSLAFFDGCQNFISLSLCVSSFDPQGCHHVAEHSKERRF